MITPANSLGCSQLLVGWSGVHRSDLSMIAEAFRRSSVRRLLAYDKAAVEKMKTG
jgi:hypothetical protein